MVASVYIYGVPLLLVIVIYLVRRQRRESAAIEARRVSEVAGMVEPPSLHPLIDPVKCLGCGSCATACPEGNVLGLVAGKAQLINPTHCIGHGACKAACPLDAITLVFGTETRGVDIPWVDPDFQTNVTGIYIAGELGGMGLIRNAIEQGRQAVDSVRKLEGLGRTDRHDLVIVGAGPAGFAATLAAKAHGLNTVTVEQDTLGGTVAHFPRGKIVMTAPVDLPIIGKVRFTETTKEALLEFWQDVERRAELTINYQERVETVTPDGDGFVVGTSHSQHRTRAVLLTIGRRGTPRTLDVPGEEQSKVVYRLIDPAQYRGQHVLVVGGGDSALEAAASIADEPGTTVSLSYRSEAFGRAKEKNRTRVDAAAADGRLALLMKSTVNRIGDDHVDLDHDGQSVQIANDAVIVCAGGILPTGFLKSLGVTVETKYGTA
jgi:thioredoxin reductase/Pyruvate/2-oxoacid:ferredoxin oxidoreductase delta subunit